MVFQETNERFRRDSEGGITAGSFLPPVRLALVKVTVFSGGDEFLRASLVVGVIGFVPAGQGDDGAMMPVVIPQSVEIVSAFLTRPNEFRFLRFIFGDEDEIAVRSGRSNGALNCADNVVFGVVMNGLGCVEPVTVEMKFLDPIAGVGNEKFAHGLGVRTIEVD